MVFNKVFLYYGKSFDINILPCKTFVEEFYTTDLMP